MRGPFSPLSSIEMHRRDMDQARGDEDKKKRHVQDMPYREQSLVHAEFRHLAGCAQASRDVVEGNALESLFLSRDGFVSGRRQLNHGPRIAMQETLTQKETQSKEERSNKHAEPAPAAHFE